MPKTSVYSFRTVLNNTLFQYHIETNKDEQNLHIITKTYADSDCDIVVAKVTQVAIAEEFMLTLQKHHR